MITNKCSCGLLRSDRLSGAVGALEIKRRRSVFTARVDKINRSTGHREHCRLQWAKWTATTRQRHFRKLRADETGRVSSGPLRPTTVTRPIRPQASQCSRPWGSLSCVRRHGTVGTLDSLESAILPEQQPLSAGRHLAPLMAIHATKPDFALSVAAAARNLESRLVSRNPMPPEQSCCILLLISSYRLQRLRRSKRVRMAAKKIAAPLPPSQRSRDPLPAAVRPSFASFIARGRRRPVGTRATSACSRFNLGRKSVMLTNPPVIVAAGRGLRHDCLAHSARGAVRDCGV